MLILSQLVMISILPIRYDYSPTCVGSKKFNDNTDNKLAASDWENINANITESLQI